MNNYYNQENKHNQINKYYNQTNDYNSSNFMIPYNDYRKDRHRETYDLNLYRLPTIDYKDDKNHLIDRSPDFIYKPHNSYYWRSSKQNNYIYDVDSTMLDRKIQLSMKAKRQKKHMAYNNRNRINLIRKHVAIPLKGVKDIEWWNNLYEDDEVIMKPRSLYSTNSMNLLLN